LSRILSFGTFLRRIFRLSLNALLKCVSFTAQTLLELSSNDNILLRDSFFRPILCQNLRCFSMYHLNTSHTLLDFSSNCPKKSHFYSMMVMRTLFT